MDEKELHAVFNQEMTECGIYSNLMEGLQHIYDDVIEIDALRNEAMIWRNSQNPTIEMTNVCYSKLMEWFIEYVVIEQEVPRYRQMLDLGKLKREMGKFHRYEAFDTKYKIDGPERFHWYRVSIIWTGKNKFLLFSQNINDQKRQEIISKATNQEYDFIICLDAKQNTYFVYENIEKGEVLPPMICDDYQKSAEEFASRFVVPEQIEYVIREMKLDVVLQKLEQFGEHIFYEDTINRNGEVRHKKIRYIYYNKVDKIILITRTDCTDFFQKEREKKKMLLAAFQESKTANHAKMEFLARMSREFYIPLNSVIGLSAIAGTHLEDREQIMECLDKINDSSQQLIALVNEVLEMAKVSGKPDKFREEEFLIDHWKECLLHQCQKAASLKHQKIVMTGEGELHAKVLGDTQALMSVCDNIMKNAFQYTPENGTIQMNLREELSLNRRYGHFFLTISDNGIGIEKEILPKVEGTFFTEHHVDWKDVNGSGIGLNIAAKIAQRMHGDVLVQSEGGNGTAVRFEFYLKIVETDENRDANYIAMRELDFRDKKILIAEDNAISRQIINEMLKITGIEIVEAVNGQELIDIYKEAEPFTYDAIFMDVLMPKIDGYEAAKRIRQMGRPDSASIPIFGMTANIFEEDSFEAVKAGMNEYFMKPFRFEQIANTLQKFLG